MKYQSADDVGGFTYINGPPVAALGSPLEDNARPLGPSEYRRDGLIHDLKEAWFPVAGPNRLPDQFSSYWRCAIIASDRFLAVIRQDALKLDRAIHAVPARIFRGQRPTRCIASYTLLWPTVTHDVLDRSRSEFTLYKGTDVIDQVRKWSIAPEREPQADLYCSSLHTWIATAAVRDAVTRERLTGFSFIPIG
jgi:hypothetical protein